MLSLLLLSLIPADLPSDISSETEVAVIVVKGTVEFVDGTHHKLYVKCTDGHERFFDLPKGVLVEIDGRKDNSIADLVVTSQGWALDVTVTIHRMGTNFTAVKVAAVKITYLK